MRKGERNTPVCLVLHLECYVYIYSVIDSLDYGNLLSLDVI